MVRHTHTNVTHGRTVGEWPYAALAPVTAPTVIDLPICSRSHTLTSSQVALSSSAPALPRRLISWSGFATSRSVSSHGCASASHASYISHNRHTPHAQPAASKHCGGKYPRSPARARTRQRVQPGAGRGATTTTRRDMAALRRPGEHLRRYGHELAAKRTRDAQPLQLRQQALPVRLSQRTLCHDSRDLMQSQLPRNRGFT